MSNALRRAIRTFVQTLTGTIIASGILSATAESGVVDWSALKKVAISALAAGIVAVLSFTQNALEDHDVIPAALKGNGGHADTALITCIAVVLIAIVVVLWAVGVDFPLS